MKAATKRAVTVLVRYEMKQDCPEKGLHKGDVVLYIENDKGVRYYTTLRRNKSHSCTCVSHKPCYHIKQMVERENARFEARKAARKVVVLPVPPVEKPKVTDISTKGALNGNRGFSLLKVS